MSSTSTTMTIRLDPQLKAKLGRLAEGTRRSRSFLAAEAVETYVDRELNALQDALVAGETSGPPQPFDFEEFKARKRTEHQTRPSPRIP